MPVEIFPFSRVDNMLHHEYDHRTIKYKEGISKQIIINKRSRPKLNRRSRNTFSELSEV